MDRILTQNRENHSFWGCAWSLHQIECPSLRLTAQARSLACSDPGGVPTAMRRLTRNLIILLVLVGVFSYLILPALVEDQIARRLQTSFGTPAKPDVEVSSNFPPLMLLGRIDEVRVTMDQANLQGAILYNTTADLQGVEISLPQLVQGNLDVTTTSCSLSVESPPISITENQACLGYLGLGSAGY
jgi:LmeA-like phospholipid-binding